MADDYRQWLVQAHHDASQDFDKALMTLSGGALALSVTFVHDIPRIPIVAGSWLLVGGYWR